MALRPFLLALALAVPLAPAAAQTSALKGHNGDAPVDVDADRIEVQDRADRAIFSGNVKIRQGDLNLDAARVTVAYAQVAGSPQVNRLDASGGVRLTSPSERARGDFAIYDVNGRTVTMIGNVVLNRAGSEVRGGRLVLDLASGRASVDGRGTGAAPGTATTGSGGRVSGRFTVRQNQ